MTTSAFSWWSPLPGAISVITLLSRSVSLPQITVSGFISQICKPLIWWDLGSPAGADYTPGLWQHLFCFYFSLKLCMPESIQFHHCLAPQIKIRELPNTKNGKTSRWLELTQGISALNTEYKFLFQKNTRELPSGTWNPLSGNGALQTIFIPGHCLLPLYC